MNDAIRASYQALGLKYGATEDAVTKAYKELGRTTHPDKPGGSQGAFLKVKEAFDKLKERFGKPSGDLFGPGGGGSSSSSSSSGYMPAGWVPPQQGTARANWPGGKQHKDMESEINNIFRNNPQFKAQASAEAKARAEA